MELTSNIQTVVIVCILLCITPHEACRNIDRLNIWPTTKATLVGELEPAYGIQYTRATDVSMSSSIIQSVKRALIQYFKGNMETKVSCTPNMSKKYSAGHVIAESLLTGGPVHTHISNPGTKILKTNKIYGKVVAAQSLQKGRVRPPGNPGTYIPRGPRSDTLFEKDFVTKVIAQSLQNDHVTPSRNKDPIAQTFTKKDFARESEVIPQSLQKGRVRPPGNPGTYIPRGPRSDTLFEKDFVTKVIAQSLQKGHVTPSGNKDPIAQAFTQKDFAREGEVIPQSLQKARVRPPGNPGTHIPRGPRSDTLFEKDFVTEVIAQSLSKGPVPTPGNKGSHIPMAQSVTLKDFASEGEVIMHHLQKGHVRPPENLRTYIPERPKSDTVFEKNFVTKDPVPTPGNPGTNIPKSYLINQNFKQESIRKSLARPVSPVGGSYIAIRPTKNQH